MKHLGIILASIILVLALGAEAKNPYAKQIKQLKKELAQIEKDLETLPNTTTHPRIVRERERLQNEQIGVVEVLQQLDPNSDYSAYLPKSAEPEAAGNDMTENRAEPETAVSEAQSKANPNEEITLTVTSDGTTKDEAIKNALRTAIEQAYGAFVSANTTILNDELVKDEIVTVSNGSIKDYKILSEYEKSDGSGYGVTANATVSLPHLITYAKNHGSECEFAGNTFGMEMKLFKLQKENELKALYNCIPIVESMIRNSLRWNITVEEPRIANNVLADVISEIKNGVYKGSDSKYYLYSGAFKNDIRSLNYLLYGSLGHPIKRDLNTKLFERVVPLAKGDNVSITFRIGCVYDYNNLKQYIQNLLGGLSLSYAEYNNYSKKGFNPGKFSYRGLYGFVKVPYKEDVLYLDEIGWWFRNSQEDLNRWYDILKISILQIKNDFKIIDNTGQESYFNPSYFALRPVIVGGGNKYMHIGGLSFSAYDNSEEVWARCLDFFNNHFIGETDGNRDKFSGSFSGLNKYAYSGYGSCFGIGGSGLFSNLFKIPADVFNSSGNNIRALVDLHCDWRDPRTEPDDPMMPWKITIFLPASEIEKYSSFKVTTANTPKLDIPFDDIRWDYGKTGF